MVSREKALIGTNNQNPIGTNTSRMERRHRIFQNEIIHVIKAIHSHLTATMTNPDTSTTETTALFRVLWRFKEHRTGPPNYPEIDATNIATLLQEVEALITLHNC